MPDPRPPTSSPFPPFRTCSTRDGSERRSALANRPRRPHIAGHVGRRYPDPRHRMAVSRRRRCLIPTRWRRWRRAPPRLPRVTARELIWLLEHPPLYTAGTSADPDELLDPRFPVHRAGRGGRYTYHGPGQRVGYAMLDLNRRGRDVRCYVHALEGWVIAALGRVGIDGVSRAGPDRHLDARRQRPRGEDRRDRRAGEALGDAPRLFGEPRPRPVAFRRNRAVRAGRTPGHQRGGAGKRQFRRQPLTQALALEFPTFLERLDRYLVAGSEMTA